MIIINIWYIGALKLYIIIKLPIPRARRAAKEALEKEQSNQSMLPAPAKARVKVKAFIKIGRPGYKVTKQKDTKSDQHSLLFQVWLLTKLCFVHWYIRLCMYHVVFDLVKQRLFATYKVFFSRFSAVWPLRICLWILYWRYHFRSITPRL